MKYVFLFCESKSEEAERGAVRSAGSPEGIRDFYRSRMEWFQTNGAKIRGGHELHPTPTATTVRSGEGGRAIVTDGPFVEGNEVIGGYVEVEVADLDEALALAKTWPGGTVEIRPVYERRR